jgi:hypothetical protein
VRARARCHRRRGAALGKTLWIVVTLLLSPGPLGAEESSRLLALIADADLSLASADRSRLARLPDQLELSLPCEELDVCGLLALDPDTPSEPSASATPSAGPGAEKKPPSKLLTSLIAATAVAGAAANSFTESPHEPFHVTHEGWFGEDAYVGGADKASHFVDYYIISKELAFLFEKVGWERGQSIWLGLGVSLLAGLTAEFGDGTSQYGFSFEDLSMDAFGAGSAALIAALRAQDLVGFRRGFLLPPSGDDTCCQVEGLGRDYSNEIYTADLKLAGVADRLRLKVGPLRYLLFSVTYATKGYPTGDPDFRERQVGFEIGLNLEEILNGFGVPRNTWWGYGLHFVLDNVRLPYTSVGFQYDLNHQQWYGPSNGNKYSTP